MFYSSKNFTKNVTNFQLENVLPKQYLVSNEHNKLRKLKQKSARDRA